MYISEITLRNVRCFKDLHIDFKRPGSSILIAGDNGDGKSTILRSIAMGLCDESSAAALLRELSGDFVRKGAKEATISVILRSARNHKYKIETKISALEAFEKVSQILYAWVENKWKRITAKEQEEFPWEKIFITAYGAGVRTLGTADYQHYFAVDAVYPLFKYDAPLQNPELGIRRLIEKARKSVRKNIKKSEQKAENKWKELQNILGDLLNLRPNSIKLKSYGLMVGRRGADYELGALGDGYKATTTWIIDLISWSMLHRSPRTLGSISGIVLMDEIEQHLHPRWQLTILDRLRKIFPKIQFIAATHSPLVISGSSGMTIHTLNFGEHRTHNAEGWLAEDVYRNVLGVPSSRAKPLSDEIDEYERLHYLQLTGKLSSIKRRRLIFLKRKLRALPGTDPVAISAEMESLTKLLRQKRKT